MASTERWLAKSQSAKEEIVAASPVGGQKPPKINDRLPEPQPSAGATDSGRRSSLRRPPQLAIPDPGPGAKNSTNIFGIAQQPSAAGEVKPTGALSPGLSARETVLSPSRVHMGEGMVVPNLRDSTGTKDLGIVVVKEEKYIPVALAKSQIEKMMGDMALMKVWHQEIMQKLDAQYRNIEQQSQQHYVTFIQDLKNKAQSRIDVYKKLLRETDQDHIARKNDLESRIDSLQEKLQEEAAAKCLLMEEHRTEDEMLRKSHQDALRSMEKAYEAEHSRLLSMHAAEIGARRECFSSLCSIAGEVEAQGAKAEHLNLDRRLSALNREMTSQAGTQHQQLEKVKRELYARRFKSAVDVTILRRRVESLLKQLEAQSADFERQYQALQHRFRSELHDVQQEGVRANVEAVVEDLMLRVEERLWDEDKGRLFNASRELSRAKTMIDDLESRVMVRDTSIAALQREVQDGKQALTGLERSKQDAEAIIEELKAKTVTLTADSDKVEELEEARASAEKRMEELSKRLQQNEYKDEEGKNKEVQELESLTRVRDEDNSKIAELQAKMKSLIEYNARLEAALKQVQAGAQVKMATPVDTSTLAVTASSLSTSSALVDIERLQARMAELQARIAAATPSQQEDQENKRVQKATIKAWMTEFEEREGRAPTNQDKAQARDLFVAYRNAESRAKASSDSLAALQQELEAVKGELAAALQRTSAPLSFTTTSAVPVSAIQGGAPTSVPRHHEEIARLDARVAELEEAVQNGRAAAGALETEKKTKKTQIKEWMADFEQKEGRPPNNQDKEAVKELFVDYRKLELRSKTEADSLAVLVQDLETAKAQLASARANAPPVTAASGQAASNPAAEITAAKKVLRDLEVKAKALRDAIEETEALKKVKKAQIKEWMTDFEQREGRPPTNQDKESVKELFVDYRKYELKTKADTESLGIAQQAIEAAQAEVQRLEAGRANVVTSTQSSPPVASVVENSEQLEDERRRRAAAEEAVRRTERERDQLRDAIYQLQEAMKSLDTSGQINELVKQVRAAQEAAGTADSRSAALEKIVEQGKGEAVAFRQELRKNKKALEEAEARAKEAETELKKIDAALKSGGDLSALRGARAPGVSEKEVETMRQQIRSMQAMVESGRAAANVLEQKLAIAEEKARVTEDFARSQMEAAKKLQASGGSRRNLAAELATSPTGGLRSVPSEASLKSASDMVEAAILQGNNLLKLNKKAETFTLYKTTTEKLLKMLPPGATRDRLNEALSLASKQGALNGPTTLRKAFDTYLAEARSRSPLNSSGVGEVQAPSMPDSAAGGAAADNEEAEGRMRELQRKLQELQQQSNSVQAAVSPTTSFSMSMSAMGGDANEAIRAATERYLEAEARVEELERQLAEVQDGSGDTADEGLGTEEEEAAPSTSSAVKGNPTKAGAVQNSATTAGQGGGAGSAALQQKVKTLEKKAKDDALKLRKLEDQLAKAQAAPVTSGGGDGITAKQLEKELQNQEKKLKKTFDDDMKKKEKEVTILQTQLKKATKDLEDTQAELAAMKEERDKFKRQAADLGSITQEVEQLRVRAQEAAAMEVAIKQNEEKIATLEIQYREETALRKKYWNMMEDMKGKIRVYARCRPFAKYEIERGCSQAVNFVDDTTLEIESSRGTKQFIFDTCFTMDSTQDQVFSDTRNLIQSCIDGYNVCIFAYGQTGSGKTFTMTGSADMPGITPRCITELYALLGKLKNCEYTVTTCFVELYNDRLQDLFYMLDNPRAKREDLPDLDVKLNDKKMVFVRGAIVKPAQNPDELMQLFTEGNSKRKVGGTKMNAESSRSHSIFSVLVEVLNKTTGKATAGKLSLVDLAGSERADKTGATDDRLKEAMNINKSLAALGDVISALSQNEKFIPYRNNKLTQLMQDSLGGNAKTLMFVNISPADYNSDETVTSLAYAARVKLITNTANKNQDSEEVAKLKAIIKALKAGQSVPELEDMGAHAPAGGGGADV